MNRFFLSEPSFLYATNPKPSIINTITSSVFALFFSHSNGWDLQKSQIYVCKQFMKCLNLVKDLGFLLLCVFFFPILTSVDTPIRFEYEQYRAFHNFWTVEKTVSNSRLETR